MKHYLEIQPIYFNEILSGVKKFEIRLDDRGYSVSDVLVLNEYEGFDDIYTGRSLSVKVKHIHVSIGLLSNYIILSFNGFFDLV